jgi:hypothetical protein
MGQLSTVLSLFVSAPARTPQQVMLRRTDENTLLR